ncbi:MFS transporter [Curtobacterium sp. MCPF17_051]|uniref:MFS transporter n=1 Tax=Curtobacterium sp. MCPF17_051 TaxID=2175640 RepID=UPI000DAAAEFA|nr:MFS transporter [Curtobacterium sp. MCPF17_051]PZF26050.1 MFS transporter [Curtobacterium sp. MCPF17_051]
MDIPATRGIPTSVVEKTAIRKIAIRIVPFVALMFFINFLDRTAISFAAPNGMEADLGLTAAQFGFASGVFFIGYLVLEVPSNLALHRFGARIWLARIMITWGIVSLLFTWVQNYPQLVGLRFLLGIAEAGFFPGAILFLSTWVPARHRGKMLALFYLAQPLTSVIGSPLAGWLMTHEGILGGLAGWRFMFLCVSIPAIIVGVLCLFVLKDKPSQAKWLDEDEKVWLETTLAAESAAKGGGDGHGKGGLRAAFGSGRVWMLAAVYFGFIYGLYALSFFLPTIIDGFQEQFGTTFDLFQKGLITAIPYVPAAVVLYFWSRDAFRRGVRVWHIAVPALVGGLSIPVALYMNSPAATVAVIAITACAIFAALPNFWTVPTQFLSGAAAAAGVALINTVGNLGGFAAPYITGAVSEWTGGYQVPMFIVGFFMVLSSVLMFVLGRNTKRNEAAAAASGADTAVAATDGPTAIAKEAGA